MIGFLWVLLWVMGNKGGDDEDDVELRVGFCFIFIRFFVIFGLD